MMNLSILANWAQIVSLLIAIFAIAVSIWVFRRSQQTRSLTCVFDQISSLIEVQAGNALEGEIEIRYSRKVIKNLFIVRACLKNTGNKAIRNSDVIEPVTFVFEPSASLLREPGIVEKKPKNVKVDWKIHKTGKPPKINTASMNFELLNPDDELTVEFLCTGQPGLPKVTARIQDIPELEVIDPTEIQLGKEFAKLRSAPGILMLILLIGLTWISFQMILEIWKQGLSLLAFIFGSLILFAMIMLWINVLRPAYDLTHYRKSKKID